MLLRKQSTKFTSLPLLFVSKRFCSSVAVYAAYIPFYDMRANIFKLDTSSSFRSQKRLLRLCALRYLINDCCVQQLWARGSLLFRGSETQDLYPHNKGTIDMAAALSFACSANGKVQHVSKRKQAQHMDEGGCTNCHKVLPCKELMEGSLVPWSRLQVQACTQHIPGSQACVLS